MLRYKCISQPQCLMPCSSFGVFLFLFGGGVTHIGGTIVISYLFHCREFFCAPCIDSSKWKCIGEHHSICIKMEMYCIMIMAMIAFEIYCVYWFNFSLVVSCIT